MQGYADIKQENKMKSAYQLGRIDNKDVASVYHVCSKY